MVDLSSLTSHLQGLGRVLLGYSGGVDSALLAVIGARAAGPDRFLAVIGRSPSYPAVQYAAAIRVAREFDVPLLEVATDEMEDPDYVANPINRCYFCKQELWRRLRLIATIRDSTPSSMGPTPTTSGNIVRAWAPRASMSIRSPLAELGWSKPMIREAAKELGHSDLGCSSRALSLQPGEVWTAGYRRAVTSGRSGRGAASRDRRIGRPAGPPSRRSRPDRGSLRNKSPWLSASWPRVLSGFQALGVADVRLDPRGYRRGGLLTELPVLSG